MKMVVLKFDERAKLTRQSSCVNARGIPPAAWRVLLLLSQPGRGDLIPGLGPDGGGYPIPGPDGGNPSLARVTPPHLGLDLGWGTPPHLDLAGVLPIWTWPGYPHSPPPPPPSGPYYVRWR